jgi:hypothetical protein
VVVQQLEPQIMEWSQEVTTRHRRSSKAVISPDLRLLRVIRDAVAQDDHHFDTKTSPRNMMIANRLT